VSDLEVLRCKFVSMLSDRESRTQGCLPSIGSFPLSALRTCSRGQKQCGPGENPLGNMCVCVCVCVCVRGARVGETGGARVWTVEAWNNDRIVTPQQKGRNESVGYILSQRRCLC